MAIKERAQKVHDELFPDHVSTLKETDPELIETFDNFAFDEVLEHGSLDARTRLMAQLAALIACQAHSEYRVTVGAALTIGVTPVEVKEIVYQAVPYVGMGKAFDFIHATNGVMTERGIRLPLKGQSTTTPETRMDKGLEVEKEIVGAEVVEEFYASAPDDEGHIQRLLSANCFGDHYTRGGIDVRTRELLTFAMLVSLGGCEPQARGHVVANLHVGNDRAVLLGVVTQLLPFIGYPGTLNVLRVIDDVTLGRRSSCARGGQAVEIEVAGTCARGNVSSSHGETYHDVICLGGAGLQPGSSRAVWLSPPPLSFRQRSPCKWRPGGHEVSQGVAATALCR